MRPPLPERFGRRLGAAAPVLLACAVSVLLLGLLEAWRHFYFLTDDNLSSHLPILSEIGRNLLHGRSIFTSSFLYGGGYSLLRDPGCLWCWHPLVLLVSLLANTPALFWIIEIIAGSQLLLSVVCFMLLLNCVRKELNPDLGSGVVVFLGLSYGFTAFNVLVGPSWHPYLANQVALPLYLWGILHPRRGRGIALVGAGCMHACLTGLPSPWVFSLIFGSAMAVGTSLARRSWEAMGRWALGIGIALLLLSPVLVPALGGFWNSPRSEPLGLAAASSLSMPCHAVLVSSLLGTFSKWVPFAFENTGFFALCEDHVRALGCCAAGWLLLPAIRGSRRWRALELVMAILFAVVLLVVSRPAWLGRCFLHLPLLQSIRWPFREILVAQFFLHVFIALRLPRMAPWRSVFLGALGTLVLAVSVVAPGPPSFNPMERDRFLVLSGRAGQFWDGVRARLGEADGYYPLASPKLVYLHFGWKFPYSLLGAYNYPALFRVRSQAGYLPAQPRDLDGSAPVPYFWGGIFDPKERDRLRARKPHAAFLEVERLYPLQMTLEINGREVQLETPERWVPEMR